MLYSLVTFTFNFLFKTFYSYTVIGEDNIPEGPGIIAPNHASFLDPPLVNISHPKPFHFFARKTLFRNPFLGYLFKKLNAHPIGPGAEGVRAIALAKQLLSKNEVVVLFPEGTRSEDGKMLPLQKGVVRLSLKSKVPITPLYIFGAYDIWPRGRKFPRVTGKVGCVYAPPIDPANYEHLGAQEATDAMLVELEKALRSMEKLYGHENK